MPGWKKVVSLFGLSVCAAVLGAACTSEVKDSTDPTESAEIAEEAAVVVTPPVVVVPPIRPRPPVVVVPPVRPGPPILPPPSRERERRICESRCRDSFDRCLREGRGLSERARHLREISCRRGREECFERCRRF